MLPKRRVIGAKCDTSRWWLRQPLRERVSIDSWYHVCNFGAHLRAENPRLQAALRAHASCVAPTSSVAYGPSVNRVWRNMSN